MKKFLSKPSCEGEYEAKMDKNRWTGLYSTMAEDNRDFYWAVK
jgi:hypothetical protein